MNEIARKGLNIMEKSGLTKFTKEFYINNPEFKDVW
jgi:hypothetical protein